MATGVEPIDSQHKELFRRFDLFLAACESGKGIVDLIDLHEFLSDYAATHFRDEEQFLLQHDSPEYEAHCREHRQFNDSLMRMRQNIVSGEAELHHVIDTNALLFKWIVNHISQADRELGKISGVRSAV